MFASYPLASRPLSSSPRVPRAFRVGALSGEYGFSAWAYSRQAKINAWGWHGLGPLGNVNSWASLGNAVYLRNDADDLVYIIQPDVFLAKSDVSKESTSVFVQTQWLDFGKPGAMKSLDAIDMDVLGITAIEVYVFVPNPADPRDRTGTLAATISLVNAESGWTYNGEQISTEDVGAATEFQLKFIGEPNQEVQINRLTLWWSPVAT